MAREILVHNAERTLSKEPDEHGWIPLHYAAFYGHVSILKMLLEFDISSAYMAEKTDHKTALHIAAGHGNTDLMKELLSRCPDCYEMVDYRGRNALHFAVESRCREAVDLVLNDSSLSNLINEQDAQGNTPLHLLAASSFSQTQMLDSFISHPKVDAMVFDKQNRSAVDIIALSNDIIVSEAKELIIHRLEDVGSRRNWRLINPKANDQMEAKDNGKNNSLKIEMMKKDGIIDNNTEPDITEAIVEVRGEAGNNSINGTHDMISKVNGISHDSSTISDDIIRAFQKGEDPHLLVATLTATVTYAAGFTMPGGYISEKGPHQGQAVLTRSSAFQTFVISDTIALMLSSFAVLIHILAPLYDYGRKKKSLTRLFKAQYHFTTFSMLAMVIAFVAATYAVLSRSSALAIATCVIGTIYAPLPMLGIFLTYRLNKHYKNKNTFKTD